MLGSFGRLCPEGPLLLLFFFRFLLLLVSLPVCLHVCIRLLLALLVVMMVVVMMVLIVFLGALPLSWRSVSFLLRAVALERQHNRQQTERNQQKPTNKITAHSKTHFPIKSHTDTHRGKSNPKKTRVWSWRHAELHPSTHTYQTSKYKLIPALHHSQHCLPLQSYISRFECKGGQRYKF